MTPRHRQLAAIRGEMPDLLPYAPRIDLWYNANSLAGTLPRNHQGRTQDEISLAEGWAFHKGLPDLLDLRTPEDILHRAIGVMATRHSVHNFRFSSNIMIDVTRQGNTVRVEYHAPAGKIQTETIFPEEMKRAGSTISIISEHPIKAQQDYKVLASLFENIELVPNYADYLAWEKSVGDNGFCCAYASFAASPMHFIQRDFLNPTEFFLHYNDYHKEMRYLAEVIEHYYFEPLLRIVADSPAEGVHWGANYDDMITYPPYFEKEMLPWLQKVSDRLHTKGKIVFCHCDGENLGLMDLIKATGIDMAEAICPHPMTKLAIDEYYRQWSDTMTIFGGIPSNLLLAQSASEEEFEAYLDYFFKAIAPGSRFIVGIADTTPPDAVFERLVRIGERVEKECRLPLEAGAFNAVSEDRLTEVAARTVSEKDLDDAFRAVQRAVFDGHEKDIRAHIMDLINQGVGARDILDKGLIAAMEIIGTKFKSGELFIPEVLLSSRAMNQGLAVLEQYLSEGRQSRTVRVLLGTVKGDLHDIGKNMVGTLLRGVGYEVKDLGVNVASSEFIKKTREYQPHVVALSALLTTTMPQMSAVINELRQAGLRDSVKVMVGGAPVNQKYAVDIGADGYAADAGGAVELANRLTGQ